MHNYLPFSSRRHRNRSVVRKHMPLRVEMLEARELLATIVVSNTADAGPGSLRQAILDANAATEASAVVFNIPQSDPNFIDVDASMPGGDQAPDAWRIQPLTELPELTASVGIMLDGHSQSIFAGEPNAFGPEIILDGDGLFARGLTIRTNDHTIRGFNIQDFGRSGIDLFGGDRVMIIANYIGVDATGTLPAGNARWGINVNGDADHNRIGTDADTIGDGFERNIIGGNGFDGIGITGEGNDFNVIAGNYIGTNRHGTGKIGNLQDGVEISGGGQFNRVGALADGPNPFVEANVISGNTLSGVSISGANTRGNIVAGNLIGTDAFGTGALGNSASGVFLSGGANQNIIGGSSPHARNAISGNTDSGITLRGAGTSENRISANYIGISRTDAIALANGERGVLIDTGATKNIIGTDGDGVKDAAEGNVISGNLQSGISIQGVGSDENVVAGNLIGTNPLGLSALGNANRGVSIFGGAKRNRIGTNGDGRSDVLERNVLSGNTWEGVGISEAGTSLNVVAGNFIGTDVRGTQDLGNGFRGVAIFLGASQNTIGGSKPELRNLISGNGSGGVNLTTGATQNHVAGNYIGTDVTGKLALGNTFTGVQMANGATNNIVGTNSDGTDDALEGNLISANTEYGVRMTDAGTANNIVAGNLIGTDVSGMGDLGNLLRGVAIENGAGFARIGGTTVAARNVISGNDTGGIRITGSGLPGATGNVIIGNYIGTNISGSAAVANGSFGVVLETGSPGNRIGTDGDGASDAAEGNLIAGNANSGVRMFGAGTTNNIVAGNRIGTNAAGLAALANAGHGVSIGQGAAANRVGTNGDGVSDDVERNLIAGNTNRGVLLSDEGTDSNIVAGNYIGTNISATAAIANVSDGVLVQLGASFNRIGTDGNGQADDAERNVIAGNGGAGINLAGAGTVLNTIAGNWIGTNSSGTLDLGNTTEGIRLQTSVQDNRIGGSAALANTIAFNKRSGVGLFSSAGTGNSILTNSIYGNGLLGIDLGVDGLTLNDSFDGDSGPNRVQNSPAIGAVLIGRSLTIDYVVDSLPANATYPITIELFLADSRLEEGQTVVRSIVYEAADAMLNKRLSFVPGFMVAGGTLFVATATDAAGNTSEFSAVAVTEDRPSPWHNYEKPLDVDGSGFALASDALAVINRLNAFGSGFVPIDADVGPDFYDTTNEGQVTAADALAIINAINAGLAGGGEGEADFEVVGVVVRAMATDELLALWPDIETLRSRGRRAP